MFIRQNLLLGIFFWRESLAAAFGPERMGEKGGCGGKRGVVGGNGLFAAVVDIEAGVFPGEEIG